MLTLSCAHDFLHSASYVRDQLWLWSAPECQRLLQNVTTALQNKKVSLLRDGLRMLLIGDSTDRQLLKELCASFRGVDGGAEGGPPAGSVRRARRKRLRRVRPRRGPRMRRAGGSSRRRVAPAPEGED